LGPTPDERDCARRCAEGNPRVIGEKTKKKKKKVAKMWHVVQEKKNYPRDGRI
jgi:hypothetical protein